MVDDRAMMYMISTNHRSRWGPGSSSPQCTASQVTRAIEKSDTVYTFSLTVDWFHTVHENADTTMPLVAATRRAQRTGTMSWSHRSATRNHRPADAAEVTAANRLRRTA